MNHPLPANPDLELAVCQELSNKETWQVYSDWLQTQGHPLGEIIALELGCQNEETREKLTPELRARIQETYPDWGKEFICNSDELGRLYKIRIKQPYESYLSMDWEVGFLRRLILHLNLYEFQEELLEIIKTILNSPYARLLAGLWLKISLNPPHANYDEVLEENDEDEPLPPPLKSPEVAFAEIHKLLTETGAGKYLRHLEVGTTNERTPFNELDISPLLSNFPNLRELKVNGEFGISKLENPTLKELTLNTKGLSPDWHRILSAPSMPELKRFSLINMNRRKPLAGNISFLLENEAFQQLSYLYISFSKTNTDCLEVIAKLSLPKLKSFALSLERYRTEPSQWELLKHFFQEVTLPALSRLYIALHGCESALMPEILNSPLLPRLQELEISGNFKGNESVRPFLEQAESFRHLNVLRISETWISAGMKKKLYAVFGREVLKI